MYMRACMCVNLPLTYSPTAAGVSRSGSTVMKIGCRFGRPCNESGHTHKRNIYKKCPVSQRTMPSNDLLFYDFYHAQLIFHKR